MTPAIEKRLSGDALAGRAWRSTFAAMKRMPVLMLSVLAASVLLGVATFFAARLGVVEIATVQNPALNIAWSLASLTLQALITAPLAMHRFILLDEITTGLPSFAPAHTRIFFLWALGLHLLYFLPTEISLLTGNFLTALLVSPIHFAFWISSVFVAMVFPAIAIDVPNAGFGDRIVTSLRQMKGHFWQFAVAVILAFLPVALPILALLFWLQQQAQLLQPAAIGGHVDASALLHSNWFLAVTLVGAVENAPMIAVAAAVASWTYAAQARD